MNPIFYVAFALAGSVITVCCQGQTDATNLADKYPLATMYLSYESINDLQYILNNEPQFRKIAEGPPGEETLSMFREFLNSHRSVRLIDALAFISIDLKNWNTGYKKMSDQDGVIKVVAWNKEQVQRVAVLCDNYFNAQKQFADVFELASDANVKIATTWGKIKLMRSDPMISEIKARRLNGVFLQQFESRQSELKEIQEYDKAMYDELIQDNENWKSEEKELSERWRSFDFDGTDLMPKLNEHFKNINDSRMDLQIPNIDVIRRLMEMEELKRGLSEGSGRSR